MDGREELGKDPFTGGWYSAIRIEGGGTNIALVTVTSIADPGEITEADHKHAELLASQCISKIQKAIEEAS